MAWEWVAPAVTGAVGLGGMAFQSRTIRQQQREQRALIAAEHEAQRRQATADRLWHKRATTYVDLLTWLSDRSRYLQDLLDQGTSTFESSTLPNDLYARLNAFASGVVFAKARELETAVREATQAALETVTSEVASQSGPPKLSDSELQDRRSSLDEMHRRGSELATLVSDDLHGALDDDHGRPAKKQQKRGDGATAD